MKLILQNYDELKDVENFLFRFIFVKPFFLQIIVEDRNEVFNYKTIYNNLANGLVLETF